MLQQTQVAAVIPYYRRFLEKFPSVCELAAAPLDEVIALWAGLGYYSRARNLHRAAMRVCENFRGVFPAGLEELRSLPGVGRSTAGAIRSIAFDLPGPILDGNVRRVLVRLCALAGDPRAGGNERLLWSLAEALCPQDRPHDYAQAIMDLGATLCTPTRPACERCPWERSCRARTLGLESELPEKRRRKKLPEVRQVALVLRCCDRVLVRKRSYEALLGGLWEFPARQVPESGCAAETAGRLLAELHAPAEPELLGSLRHIYSHFRLDLRVYGARVEPDSPLVREAGQGRWVGIAELPDFPLHGAHKKALPLLDSPR